MICVRKQVAYEMSREKEGKERMTVFASTATTSSAAAGSKLYSLFNSSFSQHAYLGFGRFASTKPTRLKTIPII